MDYLELDHLSSIISLLNMEPRGLWKKLTWWETFNGIKTIKITMKSQTGKRDLSAEMSLTFMILSNHSLYWVSSCHSLFSFSVNVDLKPLDSKNLTSQSACYANLKLHLEFWSYSQLLLDSNSMKFITLWREWEATEWWKKTSGDYTRAKKMNHLPKESNHSWAKMMHAHILTRHHAML